MRLNTLLIAGAIIFSGCAYQIAPSSSAQIVSGETALTSALKRYYVLANQEITDLNEAENLNKTLEDLIENKAADVNQHGVNDLLPLTIAVQANDAKMSERLIKAGANPNITAHNIPLLSLALQEGALESAKVLLANGANPNVSGSAPSALSIALLGGITSREYRDMAIALVNNGADPNIGAIGNHTMLLYALKTSQEDLALKLVEKGARLDVADEEGLTPLSWAILLKADNVAAAILEKDTNPNIGDVYGYTPLAWAVFTNNTSAVNLLVKAGFQPKEDDRGYIAAQIAKTRTLAELKSLLSADPSTLNASAETLPNIVRFKDMEFFTVEYAAKQIAFKTTDTLLKDFLLTKPDRLVLDFARTQAVQSLSLPLEANGTFQKIAIGRHNGYYRVVVLLDKNYQYTLKRSASGPVVTLH
ncbi:MAG: AMIN domain-containing protein [Helicobacteraceae bacterium]|jgi:ankyrin repeat protein|nr:AMIN domain-containing protein [Helicobacteraceae bacterium]